jgi:site-specific DNA recombinase
MADIKFMRAAPYVRISTENQIENYSIEQQIERLESYCKAKDWKIHKIYTDAGYSGGNMERPALKQLLNDITSGKIDVVVVYKLDRLSRSQKDTLTLIEDSFLKNSVDFVSVNENFDTSTPFGRAMIGILSVFAQLEKDQITERFTMGRIGRSKAGYYHGGPTPPTGYNYINGELIVDEYKAAQVREVFELFLKGHSVNSIQRSMNEKYGGWRSHPLVLSVLRNSAYIGKVKFKGQEYNGIHKPIIDKGTYDDAQRLLKSGEREGRKTSAQKTPFRANFLLTSLVYCGKCGARYSGNHGYYKCYSRAKSSKRFIVDPNCKNMNWPISELDELVIGQIRQLQLNPGQIDGLLIAPDRPSASKDDVSKRIKDIDSQISKVIDLYQIGTIPIDDIKSRIESLQKEKANLESIVGENRDEQQITRERFIQLLNNFDDILKNGTMEERRLRVSEIIESIRILDDSVNIKWRV